MIMTLKRYVKPWILTWDCLLSNWDCHLIHIYFPLELELYYKMDLSIYLGLVTSYSCIIMTEIVTWGGSAIDTGFGTLDSCINKIGIWLVFVLILWQALLL